MIDLTNRTLYAGPIAALLVALLAFALGAMPVVLAAVAAGFAWGPLWFAVQFVASRRASVSRIVARATSALEADDLAEATRLAMLAEAVQFHRQPVEVAAD
jgi:hypothetical protein